MVKVRVQHPPEASVKIHQVLKVTETFPLTFLVLMPACLLTSLVSFHLLCCKVSGSAPALQSLFSSSSSGSAGAPAPSIGAIQAQTLRGGGTYNQQSGFKYCFREVKDGQVRRHHLLILIHGVGVLLWANSGMKKHTKPCGITVCKTICLTRALRGLVFGYFSCLLGWR